MRRLVTSMTKLATERDRERWVAFLCAQTLPLEVSQEPWKPVRRSEANAYLWGVVYKALVEAVGFTDIEWHDFYCQQYWGAVEYVKIDGSIDLRPKRSTTKDENGKRNVLKGDAFNEFLMFVESDCAKRGVFIAEDRQL